MALLHSLKTGWVRLCVAARREFLRDPDVILFEHVAETPPKGAEAR